MATELDQTEWQEPQLRKRLEPELRQRRGPSTLGDIIEATGLPAERTEPVLRELLDEYNGRLAVDEHGELVYSFPRGLHHEPNRRELIEQALTTLYGWFKVAYKVGILVILLLYFVVFVVIMIAMLIAVLAATSNSDSDLDLDGCGGDGCDLGCFPTDLLWFVGPNPTYRTQQTSFAPRQLTPHRPKPKGAERKVRPWLQAYEFVFGPEPPESDRLAAERRLLSYIRQNNGRVSPTDIVALTGCSLDEADATLLHLMVAHGGDVEVTDNATIVYTFDRLMVSAEVLPAAGRTTRNWSWWWEQREESGVLNRNTKGANWGLGAMNLFNLAWSGIFTFDPTILGAKYTAVTALLGPVPFAFSLLFFLIPLIRRGRLNAENRRKAARNARREVAAKLFALHVAADELELVTPAALVAYARKGDKVTGLAEMKAILDDLAAQWEAEPDSDAEGQMGWRFDRLRQELADVREARRNVDPEQFRLGAVEYDSDQGD